MLAACSGNGQGLDAGGRPLPSGGTVGGALTADFDSIQQHVFTPICTACHAGGGAPQGLRLDAVNSYALLVGVSSNEVSSLLRVKAGDPDNSYLIQKLEGHAPVGAQMPFGGPPLPAATIAVIRQWVSDGALRSPVAVASARFALTAAVPGMRDLVLEPPLRIVLEFSQELDVTRLDASSVHVARVSVDGSLQPVPVTLTIPAGDPRALVITPMSAFVAGRYRATTGGANATALAGIATGLAPAAGGGETVVCEFDVVAER